MAMTMISSTRVKPLLSSFLRAFFMIFSPIIIFWEWDVSCPGGSPKPPKGHKVQAPAAYRLSRALYMLIMGMMTANTTVPTMAASRMIIMGSMAAMIWPVAISTSSS